MSISKILVSQNAPRVLTQYQAVSQKFGVEFTFCPFFQIEPLTSREFRAQRINILDYTAIIFSSRHAIDAFFALAEELRNKIPETMKYFCTTELVAIYLQKHIVFRKRKVHHSKSGKIEDLALVMKKHNTEKFLMPVAEVHKDEIPAFTKAKLKVTPAVMYRTVSMEITSEEISSYDMLVFFTPSGIQSLYENMPDYQQGDQRIGLFGPLTAKAAEEHGLRIDAKGPTPELPSMASVLQKYLSDQD